MGAIGMAAGDWLVIRDIPGGREYAVSQNKWAPFQGWLIITAVALALAAVTFILASGKHDGGALALVVLFTGFLAVMFSLGSVFLLFYALPASLLRKGSARFSVTAAGVRLARKNSASYPDQIARSDISHVYFGMTGSGLQAAQPSTVVFHGAGVVGQMNATSAAVGDALGAGYAQFLSKYSFGVWLNMRGRDVYLAKHLSEPQAAYLYNEISSTLWF